MSLLKTIGISFTVYMVYILPAYAELIAPHYSEQLTLSTLVDKVYQVHPAQQSEHAQQSQIDANNQLAQSLFADQITINVNHQNDVMISNDGKQEWESSVDFPLWLPGQKQQQVLMTETMVTQLPVIQNSIKLASAALVRNALWKVIIADAMTQQSYQIWQSAMKMKNDIVARVEVGEMATTDGLLAQAHVLEMHNDYLTQQAKLTSQLDNYYFITGEKTLPIDYKEQLTQRSMVSSDHPILAVLDHAIENLKSEQHLAKYEGQTHPNVSVGIKSERDDRDESFNTSVGLGVSFALGNSVFQNVSIAKVGKALSDKQIERQLVERDLNLAVNTQRQELENKRVQLALVNQQNEIQQQFYSIQKQSFELGEINLFTLLQTQAQADKVINKKRLLEVEIQHAVAMLNQALGYIP